MVLDVSKFCEITTFSSLISFAISLEEEARRLCEEGTSEYPNLITILDEIGREHIRRSRLLVDTRREKLSEMILEPISDLHKGKYLSPIEKRVANTEEEFVLLLRELENVSADFYRDSAKAAKSLLAEASRTFERLARGNEENAGKAATAWYKIAN